MIFFGQIKRKAIKGLKSNWVSICLTILLISLANIVTRVVVDYLTYPTINEINNNLIVQLESAMELQNSDAIYAIAIEIVYAYGAVLLLEAITIAVEVLCFIFSLSTVKAFISISKGEKYKLRDYALNWTNIKNSFTLEFTKNIMIVLWSLLLVIPGIIKMFAYSQAMQIKVRNPNKKAMECLKESENMMKGHKMEFFSFKISFIGWYLLVSIVITLLDMILFSFIKIEYNVIWMIVFTILSFIISIPLTAYVGVADTLYYEALVEHIKNPKPIPNPFIIFGPMGQNPNKTPFENFGGEGETKEEGEKDPFSDF